VRRRTRERLYRGIVMGLGIAIVVALMISVMPPI
jgi:hypothetical protein